MLLSHILTKKNYKTPFQETFDFGSYKLQDHRSYQRGITVVFEKLLS